MPAFELALVFLLILLNGLLAMMELAVVSSRRVRLQALVAKGVRGSRRALKLASDPGKFLSSVQFGITLIGIFAGAFSGATLGEDVSRWLEGLGLSRGFANPIGFGLIVALITYISLVIGELVPKQLALRNPEAVACAGAPAMTLLSKIASPFVWLLDASGRLVLKLFGKRTASEDRVTDEEIRMLVAEAETAGVIEPEERKMISGVMRLGDLPVRAVMTPRYEVDVIDLTESASAIRAAIEKSVHARLPAHKGKPEEIVGVIQAKDLLNAYIKGRKPPDPARLVRPAPVIPETMDALEVIERLKSSEVHMGLVHDEYGHFEGIVTTGDILEAIAGAFRTEEGAPEPMASQRDDGSWLMDGTMPVEELVEITRVELGAKRSYHTLAGYVLEQLGHLPALGESFETQGWRFEVVDLDGRRIDKVLASRVLARVRAVKSP
jgi:putative hemolysin